MDETVLEALVNIDDEDNKQDIVTVDLPTVISAFQEIPCPNPNLRDRCQLVSAEITLVGTNDTWPEFERTLEVAIAIGRLRFNLYGIDPNSPVNIIDSFWQPNSR